MSLIRLNTDPSRNQLLQFAGAWVVFFLAAAILAAWRSAPATAWAFGAVAIIPPLVGWMVPRFLRCLYVALAVITFPIGFVVSYLVLAVVYYLVLAPTGILLRWIKPGLFPKGPDSSLSTYWQARPEPRDPSDYFKMY